MRHAITKVAVLGLVLGLGACDTTTGPDMDVPFDAQQVMDDHAVLDAVLASDQWRNFRAFGGKVPADLIGPGGELALGAALQLEGLRGGEFGASSGRLRTLTQAAGLAVGAAPLISEFNRGKTFVYDAVQGDYVEDPERTGAPSNGVRFIVYEEFAGTPDPDREIGYADLIDQGDTSAEDIALRLIVVEDGSTVLDYWTTLDGIDDTSGRVTVGGFLTDGATQLDFDITATGNDDAFVIEFDMGVAGRDFEISGRLAEPESDHGEIRLTVRHDDASFALDVQGAPGSVDGTVHVNGDLFATLSGDPDAPTFNSADGDGLTQEEVLVLHQVFDVSEDVFDFFEDLMDPLDQIVLWAFIL